MQRRTPPVQADPALPPAVGRAIRLQLSLIRGKLHPHTVMERRLEMQQEAWVGWLQARRLGLDDEQCTRHAVRAVHRYAKREKDYHARQTSGLIDETAEQEFGEHINPRDHRGHPPVEKVLAELGGKCSRYRLILVLFGQGRTRSEVARLLCLTPAAVSKIVQKNSILWLKNRVPKCVTNRGTTSSVRRKRRTRGLQRHKSAAQRWRRSKRRQTLSASEPSGRKSA